MFLLTKKIIVAAQYNMNYLSEIYSSFALDLHYNDYSHILDCFSLNENSHRDSGGSTVYYKDEFKYPYEIDTNKNYINFVKQSLTVYPFLQDVEFSKAWWVDYPLHSYNGFHSHNPGPQLTSVLFLTTSEVDDYNPHEGFLYSLNNGDYNEYRPVAGNLHIFDGTVWHGTYPTLQPRKVFVCDFTYRLAV